MNDHDLLLAHIEEDKAFKKEIMSMLEPINKVFAESRSYTKITLYILGGVVFINSILVALHSLLGFASSMFQGK